MHGWVQAGAGKAGRELHSKPVVSTLRCSHPLWGASCSSWFSPCRGIGGAGWCRCFRCLRLFPLASPFPPSYSPTSPCKGQKLKDECSWYGRAPGRGTAAEPPAPSSPFTPRVSPPPGRCARMDALQLFSKGTVCPRRTRPMSPRHGAPSTRASWNPIRGSGPLGHLVRQLSKNAPRTAGTLRPRRHLPLCNILLASMPQQVAFTHPPPSLTPGPHLGRV